MFPSTTPKKQRRKIEYAFYGCYLLISLSPLAKNVVYIGSTPDPKKRIRQHNGEIAGGAKKTMKKRPCKL